MATSLIIMEKLIAMLIMVLLGIIVVRLKILAVRDSRVISALVVYVLQPAMIIKAFCIELTPDRAGGFLFGLMFAMTVYVAWIASVTFLKKPLSLSSVDQSTLVYSNVGNLTLPIVMMSMGKEMVFYALIMQVPFSIFVWTHCVYIIGGKKGIKPIKIILNPNVVATIVGVIIFVTGATPPDVVSTALGTLSDAVPAMSMVVVGIVIGESDLKEIFLNKKAYIITAGRLIILPAATMFLLYASGLMRAFPQFVPIIQIIFLGLAAPPASTVSQLAILFDNEPVEASVYNTFGMFFCVATIPLMNLLYEMLFV